MFAKYSFFLLIIYCANSVILGSVNKPCKIDDFACIILSGFPELGVDTSDPLHIDVLEGNLPGLKYVFRNCTVTGIKDCKLSNFIVGEDHKTLHYELNCPSVSMVAKYEAHGTIVGEPVEGDGDFTAVTGKYTIIFDSDLKTTKKDGKTYFSIENIQVKSDSQEEVKYTFGNLFNGDKDLSDHFHQFLHEHWQQVQAFTQASIWDGIIENVTKNINKYLQVTPITVSE